MCRACELGKMSREELKAVLSPILVKADAGEGLSNEDALNLIAYATLAEVEAAALYFRLVAMTTVVQDNVWQTVSPNAPLSPLPPSPNTTGEPMGDLNAEDEVQVRRILGGIVGDCSDPC